MRGEPARRDDRNRHRIGKRNGRVEIEALEHAVARHVGVDDRGDAGILEAPRDARARKAPTFPPSLRPRPCRRAHRARRRRGRDMRRAASFTSAGSRTAAVPMMTRVTPLPSQPSIVARSRMPPPSCTGILTASRMRSTAAAFIGLPAKAPSRSTMCRYSKPCAANSARLRGRIAIEHRRARHVALLQAHGIRRSFRSMAGNRITASTSGNSRSAPGRASGSSPDGIACRRCCRAPTTAVTAPP